MEFIRLNKAIADAGVCSRRKADELIFSGQVTVNDIIEQNPGRRIAPDDKLAVRGKTLQYSKKQYFMLYKPVQTMCTLHDPQGRSTICDYYPNHLKSQRLFPVGRLDFFSEGLLLLTNDGNFANYLMHPRYHLEKTYHVLVREHVPQAAITTMQQGMQLADGQALLPVSVNSKQTSRGTLLTMRLRQGVNRQIRRMCQQFGFTILKLIRIAQGPILLGNLKPGQMRPLTPQELESLGFSSNTTP